MKHTCETCKHCIWMLKRTYKGAMQTMSCAEFSEDKLVVCDPPYDETCPKYEEVEK